MQTLLTKYWVAIHVALLLFASWFGLSSSHGSSLVFLLWFALMAVEALVLLPTVRRNETLADARSRVARAVAQDPFVYIGAAVVGVVAVQWLNSGCALVFLSDAEVWQRSLPPLPWAPFSVQADDALKYVSVYSACFTGAVILRNSVGLAGKRYLLQASAVFSGVLACFVVWQACRGVQPYAGLSVTPGASAFGVFFGFWLVLGMGAYVDALAREQRASEMIFAFGVLGNLAGMLFFSSALALVLTSGVVLLFFIYWMAYLKASVPKVVQLKLFLVMMVVIVAVVLAVLYVFPGNPVITKLRAFTDFDAYWTGLKEMRDIRSEAALKIWKDHLWVGVGANGFFHYVGAVVEGKAWALIKNDQACVYNDALQILCEFGVLGASLLGAGVVTLLVPLCYRVRLAWLQGPVDGNDSRIFLLRVSPFVLAGACATVLCVIESWVANPFRSAGLLTSWMFVMATLPSFFPAKARNSA